VFLEGRRGVVRLADQRQRPPPIDAVLVPGRHAGRLVAGQQAILFISTPNEGTAQAQVNTATINADGSGLTWLTNFGPGGLRAFGNSYSPDGNWIVLRVEQDDGSGGFQSALFKMPAAGGALTQITGYSDFRPRGMTWGSVCPCSP
jgi:hypothetical protein